MPGLWPMGSTIVSRWSRRIVSIGRQLVWNPWWHVCGSTSRLETTFSAWCPMGAWMSSGWPSASWSSRAPTHAVARRGGEPDRLVSAAARALAGPRARVAGVASDLGVSERQLHRRVLAAVGYGPKMLARVARLRRLVALADEPLVSRAFAAGYASQAHMSDEVRRLTGTTPVRFLEDAGLTAA